MPIKLINENKNIIKNPNMAKRARTTKNIIETPEIVEEKNHNLSKSTDSYREPIG